MDVSSRGLLDPPRRCCRPGLRCVLSAARHVLPLRGQHQGWPRGPAPRPVRPLDGLRLVLVLCGRPRRVPVAHAGGRPAPVRRVHDLRDARRQLHPGGHLCRRQGAAQARRGPQLHCCPSHAADGALGPLGVQPPAAARRAWPLRHPRRLPRLCRPRPRTRVRLLARPTHDSRPLMRPALSTSVFVV